MSCEMSHDRLWAWVHGEASDTDAAEVERHVVGCAECGEHVDEMREILGQLDNIGLSAPAVESRAPTEIAGYEIIRKVGQGGMGVVFEAMQLQPRRRVALKLILAGQYADDIQRKLFEREVQTLARLNHPGIASIYGAGETDDGRQYFSMEFVEGASLTEFVSASVAGSDRVRAILSLFQRVCDAISYAHQRGVIHRDLKPSNVLVIRHEGTEARRHEGAEAEKHGGKEGRRHEESAGQRHGGDQEAKDGDQDVSGSDCLATGDGARQGGVPRDSNDAGRRAVRIDSANAASGSVDSVEHRGGVRPSEQTGLPSISQNGARVSNGIANSDYSRGGADDDREVNGVARDSGGIGSRPAGADSKLGGPKHVNPTVDHSVPSWLRAFVPKRSRPSAAIQYKSERPSFSQNHPIIKVLDFGLARLMEREDGGASMNTASGQLMGTLAYMSPEQAQGRPDAIDVRSDVYALGVILYELLTGEMPYSIERATLLESVRLICEQRPQRLGTIRSDVPSDVSAIVMKALEKEPERRYQSVAALSEDIDRYMNDLPIFARPASTIYQLRKMVLRHRLPFALAAMLVASVLGGGLFAYYKAVQLDRAARQVQRFNRVFTDVFQSADPWQMGRSDITVLATLDRAADEIETQLADDPIVGAAVRATLAGTYKAIGQYDKADAHYRFALGVRRDRLGSRDLDTAETMAGLAENIILRRGELAEANGLFVGALSIFQDELDAPDERIAGTLNNLGLVSKMQSKFAEAEGYYRNALHMRRELLAAVMSDPHSKQKAIATAKNNVGQTLNNLAALYRAMRSLVKAEENYRAAIKIRSEALYDIHPDNAKMANNYGQCLYDLGHFDEAELQFEKSVSILKAGLREDHPFIATALHNLAWAEYRLDRIEEATTHVDEALAMRRKLTAAGVLNENNSELADSVELRGTLLLAIGEVDAALPVLEEAVALHRKARQKGQWQTARAEGTLGECLFRLGQAERATELLTSSVEVIERERGTESIEAMDARRRFDLLP